MRSNTGLLGIAYISMGFISAIGDAVFDGTEAVTSVPILFSPDGRGEVSAVTVRPYPASISSPTQPPAQALVFHKKGLQPLAIYASVAGPSYAAWSGSSKFVLLVSGQHNVQDLELVYPTSDKLKIEPVDYGPMLKYGSRFLPIGHTLAHDEILEVTRGEGDSVRCLYYRTGDLPKAFVVTVTITFDDSVNPIRCAFSFGGRTWLRPSDTPDAIRDKWK